MHSTDILPLLASGSYLTTQDLCARLQIKPVQLEESIKEIKSLGIQIKGSANEGYCLKEVLDLVRPQDIIEQLASNVVSRLQSHKYLSVTTSTNTVALAEPCPNPGKFSFVITECQTHGRGRRGKKWQSPYAANIYLSVLWPMAKDIKQASVLSPYLALAVIELLNELGLPKLGLKWPNDIFCAQKKISGLLVECASQAKYATKLVVGIGLNVNMPVSITKNINQDWTDIKSQLSSWSLSRSQLAARLISTIVTSLASFEVEGVQDLKNKWDHWDVMRNKYVDVSGDQQSIQGIAQGIENDGCLLLQVNDQQQKIRTGDVSLRVVK